MIEKVEGIIVKEKSYSETSKIIDVVTKKYGLISLLAKGAKTLKSPLRSSSVKLVYGFFNIIYKEGRLSIVKDIDVINYYPNIKKDIVKISYSSYILDLTEQVVKQTRNEDVYDNLISCLGKIEQGLNPQIITNILELKCLSYLGVMPIMDGCSKCGDRNIVTISSDAGGFLCKNCRTIETIVDSKTVKLIRLFYYVDIDKIDRIDISKKVSDEVNFFLDNYYDKYTGLYLKSKKMIDKLSKVGEL